MVFQKQIGSIATAIAVAFALNAYGAPSWGAVGDAPQHCSARVAESTGSSLVWTKMIPALGSVELKIDRDINIDDYLTIQYGSTTAIKATLYLADADDRNELYPDRFFLEGGRDQVMNLIIQQERPGRQMETRHRYVSHVRFENLENETTKLELIKLDFARKPIHDSLIYLENANLKVGINLAWGGGLFYMAYRKEQVFQVNQRGLSKIGIDYDRLEGAEVIHSGDVNLLNHHDVGRLVQQSYYGSALPPYQPGSYLGISGLAYNPVQGGDQLENESRIIDFRYSADTIYVKCQPRDWAPATSTDSYMENTYILHKDFLEIQNRFVDFSFFQPEVREQEMPAVYTVRNLDKWVLYDGIRPFTEDRLTTLVTQGNDAENRVLNNQISENWAALVNEHDFGVGVFVPGLLEGMITTFGDLDAETDPASKYFNKPLSEANPTAYMTLTHRVAFRSLKPLEYRAFLTAGRVDAMRTVFYRLKDSGVNNRSFVRYADTRSQISTENRSK